MTEFTGQSLTCLRDQNLVFRNLSFSLDEREMLLLTGPNGSGKTSLLRIMAGLLQPTDGTISLVPNHWVGQEIPLKNDLTVSENLEFWAYVSGKMNACAVEEALGFWQISGLKHLPVRHLSSGQRRRVNLSRLLLTKRSLWLLDEPCTGLDEAGVASLKNLVSDHLSQGGMAVIATHQPHRWPASSKKLDLAGGEREIAA